MTSNYWEVIEKFNCWVQKFRIIQKCLMTSCRFMMSITFGSFFKMLFLDFFFPQICKIVDTVLLVSSLKGLAVGILIWKHHFWFSQVVIVMVIAIKILGHWAIRLQIQSVEAACDQRRRVLHEITSTTRMLCGGYDDEETQTISLCNRSKWFVLHSHDE